mmetsp:Transcript_34804/g.84107  ORF Transcript_34804/g.84107 Transcript_34804/m.84107 type:complete len:108 (-) Transcript_34804:163-486(-)
MANARKVLARREIRATTTRRRYFIIESDLPERGGENSLLAERRLYAGEPLRGSRPPEPANCKSTKGSRWTERAAVRRDAASENWSAKQRATPLGPPRVGSLRKLLQY